MFNNYFKTSYMAFFIALLFVVFSICIFTPILSSEQSIQLTAGNTKFYSVNR